MKAAKAAANESKPEHSLAVQKRDKRIYQLETDNKNLKAIAQGLASEKATLTAEKDGFRQAMNSRSDDVLDRDAEIKTWSEVVEQWKKDYAARIDDIINLKKGYATHTKHMNDKWQIQYDNSQASARRAAKTH